MRPVTRREPEADRLGLIVSRGFLAAGLMAGTALAVPAEETGAHRVTVPWKRHDRPVDASLAPWLRLPVTRFSVGPTPAAARVTWDETELRLLCEVGDATPVTGAMLDENPALGRLSDSIEIFLDVKGERTVLMDTNDYQFTVSRDGRRTTFKGSAALAQAPPKPGPAPLQPKDWGMNIPLTVAVSDGPEAGPDGTSGYRIEVAVPWAAVGGAPAAGAEVDLDVAVNDLAPGADPEAPPLVRSADWSGHALFESPSAWRRARLAPPGFWSLAGARARLALLAGLVLAGIGGAFWLGRRAIRRSIRTISAPPRVVGEAAPTSAEDPVDRLRRNLGPRLREELTAENLAELAGVSLRTLQRLFRDRFDTSPMNWLMEIRLVEAARLIRGGDDPVTKIAYRVGFKDPSHFTRRFKARFGVSPNEFRKSEEPPAGAPAGKVEP